MDFSGYLSCIALVLLLVDLSLEKTFEEDLTLTAKEKDELDMFKGLVKDRLPHDYMKEDSYLIRWLRARFFNQRNAEKMLMDNLKWREENHMDEILTEDWSDMEREYPYSMDEGRDKEGKPLLYFKVGNWDLRRASLSGRRERFHRYNNKFLEGSCSLVRELGAKYQNVSQGIQIMNMEGFNLIQHACIPCVTITIGFISQYEKHYPGSVDKIILVNVPNEAEFLVPVMRQAFHPDTNRALHIFGTNKRRWQSKLREWFEVSELPKELGGTKIYKGVGMESEGDYGDGDYTQ